ncbi:hypothetical protein [Thermithiobacillus plumbiphilus]|uniref:Uncharacterized protein n=1 Tax=Thermithiobacillus plumbiphilus TaxID=1729899 RepID=A0ABU9D6C6_9PROT
MPASLDEAINAVLLAERKAQEELERCRQEARQRLETARARAQQITHKADARIDRIRACCAQSSALQVEMLLHDNADAGAPQIPDAELEGITVAVERLAATLSSDTAPAESG